jgi:hypothetical protein
MSAARRGMARPVAAHGRRERGRMTAGRRSGGRGLGRGGQGGAGDAIVMNGRAAGSRRPIRTGIGLGKPSPPPRAKTTLEVGRLPTPGLFACEHRMEAAAGGFAHCVCSRHPTVQAGMRAVRGSTLTSAACRRELRRRGIAGAARHAEVARPLEGTCWCERGGLRITSDYVGGRRELADGASRLRSTARGRLERAQPRGRERGTRALPAGQRPPRGGSGRCARVSCKGGPTSRPPDKGLRGDGGSRAGRSPGHQTGTRPRRTRRASRYGACVEEAAPPHPPRVPARRQGVHGRARAAVFPNSARACGETRLTSAHLAFEGGFSPARTGLVRLWLGVRAVDAVRSKVALCDGTVTKRGRSKFPDSR